MKSFILAISILLSLAFNANARAPRDVPNTHVMRATSWVSDPDGILSDNGRQLADSMLNRLNTSATTEVTAVIVADLDGMDVDSYATELFELWGIGKKDRDNGMLILISRDDRRAAIRTGYGMEGAVNDGRAGRIIRNNIGPAMAAGNPDKALIDAIAAVTGYVTDPDNAGYLHSDQDSRKKKDGDDLKEFFSFMVIFGGIISAILLAIILVTYFSKKNAPDAERYAALDHMRLPSLIGIPLTLGISTIAWLVLWLLMRHTRLHKRLCPNCGTRMHRVDEVHDNDYLTPAQDIEEQLNSVDYDVWLCPACNETDIIPYINRNSSYTECPNCHSRALAMTSNRILRQPTSRTEGMGLKTFRCRNCGKSIELPYKIAKVAEPPIIIAGGGGFRGGGGGGFSGGSFGGGLTGGGGASGGW